MTERFRYVRFNFENDTQYKLRLAVFIPPCTYVLLRNEKESSHNRFFEYLINFNGDVVSKKKLTIFNFKHAGLKAFLSLFKTEIKNWFTSQISSLRFL